MATNCTQITSMTVAAAAEELGCTTAGVYYLLGKGELSRVQGVQGRVVLVTAESVARLRAARRAEGKEGRG